MYLTEALSKAKIGKKIKRSVDSCHDRLFIIVTDNVLRGALKWSDGSGLSKNSFLANDWEIVKDPPPKVEAVVYARRYIGANSIILEDCKHLFKDFEFDATDNKTKVIKITAELVEE